MLEKIEIIRFIFSIAAMLVLPIIIIGALIFILRGFVIAGKERSEAFRKFAQEAGFSYSGSHEISAIKGAEYFRLFNLGSGYGRQIENSVDGIINDFQASIFDYTFYVTFSHKKIRRQTVVLIHSSRLNLPLFSIQPKSKWILSNSGNNLIERMGLSDKTFSDKYLIIGQDLQHIKHIFNHQVISYFKTTEDFVVEGGGNRILLYRDVMMASPNQFPGMIQEGVKIAQLFAN
jgi:hypothetical protein